MISTQANKTRRPARFATFIAVALVVFLLAVTGVGCPSGTDSPPSILLRNVDLAVGDWGLGESQPVKGTALDGFQYAKVLVYQKVLTKGSLQDPSAVISGETNPLIQNPNSIQLTGDFTGNDLYVSDDGSDTVQIWRDYRDLANNAKGLVLDAADVVLDCQSSGIGDPFEILNVDNRLYVSNGMGDCEIIQGKGPGLGTEGVLVFDNAGALVDGATEPTLILNVPGPFGIAVKNDTLYVCSAGNNNQTKYTTTDAAVYVFEDITGRIEAVNGGVKGGGPLEPTVILAGPSFLDLPSGEEPFRCDVFGNRLYVSGYYALYVFDDADNLVDFQTPSAVVAYSTGVVGYRGDMKMLGNSLYVGDGYLPYPIQDFQPSKSALKADWPGMTAFRPGLTIESGQNALLSFNTTNSQISEVTAMSSEKDVLFAATGLGECCGIPTGDVHIFYDADTLTVPRPADFVLPAYKDFATAVALDTNDFYNPTPVP